MKINLNFALGGGVLYDLKLSDDIFLISHRTETRRAR